MVFDEKWNGMIEEAGGMIEVLTMPLIQRSIMKRVPMLA